ncbi:MAG: DUF1361 domain-containing protein [Prosthecobacter sp.]
MPRRLLLLNCLACLWCCLVLNVRIHITGHYYYAFLLWNLFLAAIPLGLSLGLRRISQPRRALPLLAVWLLFFPNAPYVLTDLIHLRPHNHGLVPLWLDLVMLLSFALVSLWLGFQSLRMVQHWVEQRWSKRIAWGVTVGVIGLSGFGVYLGRFLRWNSWDIVHRPHLLFQDILARVFNPLHHVQTWSFTVGFGILLMLAYLFWISAMHAPERQAERVEA